MNRVDTDRLKSDLRHVVEDVERVLQNAAIVTDSQVSELRTRASRSLREARDRLAALEAEAAERSGAVVRRGNAYAHRNPWAVAGVAAAAAFLLGWLARSR